MEEDDFFEVVNGADLAGGFLELGVVSVSMRELLGEVVVENLSQAHSLIAEIIESIEDCVNSVVAEAKGEVMGHEQVLLVYEQSAIVINPIEGKGVVM